MTATIACPVCGEPLLPLEPWQCADIDRVHWQPVIVHARCMDEWRKRKTAAADRLPFDDPPTEA